MFRLVMYGMRAYSLTWLNHQKAIQMGGQREKKQGQVIGRSRERCLQVLRNCINKRKKRGSQSSDSLVPRAQHLGFRVGVGAGLVLP